MTKIFATGATGFIGGDALYAVATAHPDYDITCLVRSSDKGAQVVKDYPRIRLVYGDLNSVELLEEESRRADIVLQCASADADVAVTAIIKGLAAHDPSRPGFLIQTSGTGILLYDDLKAQRFGESSDKVHDDLEGTSVVTSLPDDAPHRNVDKLVLAAEAQTNGVVKTAIVCPPLIYGEGRGPGSQRSHQVPELARCTLQKGHGIQVGAGKAVWENVHVHDLSALFLKLVENAAVGGSLAEWPGKPAVWGAEGYYFSENGHEAFGDVGQWVATEAKKQGLIETDEVKSISADEASQLMPMGNALWGANSRGKARRAREALKWQPSGPPLKDTIAAAVAAEARAVRPGHAKVAAGDA